MPRQRKPKPERPMLRWCSALVGLNNSVIVEAHGPGLAATMLYVAHGRKHGWVDIGVEHPQGSGKWTRWANIRGDERATILRRAYVEGGNRDA